ncbi:hypothetical protein RUM43_008768 [Polyplax serrata]|uniref:C2H2-type domain-containing protein n=1 Tax=Polyplax serrata TaxID=468196 RepID=A0AAN8NUV2_POLSC
MEEEYLEEDGEGEAEAEGGDGECEIAEGTTEFIIIDEAIGEPEYLEEGTEEEIEEELDEEDEEDEEIGEAEGEHIVEGEEIELSEVLALGEDEGFTYSPEVKYIYAEAVNENNEIIIGEVPKFNCKFCAASFKRLDSLYKHNSVHKGKTVCPVCNAVFSRVAHRTRHMRLKHPDVEVILTRKRGRVKRQTEKEIKLEDVQGDSFNILNTI